MKIHSERLARTEFLTYEGLVVSGLPEGARLAVVHDTDATDTSDTQGSKRPLLPCRLVELGLPEQKICLNTTRSMSTDELPDTDDERIPETRYSASNTFGTKSPRRFVAVTPTVFGKVEAGYKLAAISDDGHVVNSAYLTPRSAYLGLKLLELKRKLPFTRHASDQKISRITQSPIFPWRAKHTILDFLNHPNNPSYEQQQFRIKINRIIPCPTHIIVRGCIFSPNIKARLKLMCLNNRLEKVGKEPVPMGDTLELVESVPGIIELCHNFSVYLPWNTDFFAFVAADETDKTQQLAVAYLTKDEIDSMLAKTSRLFRYETDDSNYADWSEAHKAKAYELDLQRRTTLPTNTVFSIVVPLFRTPERFFHEMLCSVMEQTYPSWELILVNASPENAHLSELVDAACRADSRIQAVSLTENMGISLNTNAGIERATGDFVCFFDHDDTLEPNLLFEYARALCIHDDIDLLYCDEDVVDPEGNVVALHVKPDFDIGLLRNNNYICHLLTIRTSLLNRLEPNTPDVDGAQDHNLTLQVAEKGRSIFHVPHVLYHWRMSKNSTAAKPESKPYANTAGIRAVRQHLQRMGLEAHVEGSNTPFRYAVNYLPPASYPLVSLVIAVDCATDVLERCLQSIFEKSTYQNYEIMLVESIDTEPEARSYCEQLAAHGSYPPQARPSETHLTKAHLSQVRLCHTDKRGIVAMLNAGACKTRGEYLLFLDAATEVITPEWIERMLGLSKRKDVGAAGALLYYPDDTVQHAGMIVSAEGIGFYQQDVPRLSHPVLSQRNMAAVSFACMMCKRSSFESLIGFNETLSPLYANIDFCFSLREQGWAIVFTPEVELYHFVPAAKEFKIKHEPHNSFDEAFWHDISYLYGQWGHFIYNNDPYFTYHTSQSLELACYSL